METVPNYKSGVYSLVPYRYYDDFTDYPLAHSFKFLVILVAVYLAFVLKIGPDFMKNRPPYKLKNTILIHNAVQVVLSVVFVYLTGRALWVGGFFPPTSVQNEDPKIRKIMFISAYAYFCGKLTELLDTVFFILRKKYNQVTFLHVYHHSSVVIGTWMMVFYSLNQSAVYSAFINSLVHVVMYFYYFMAALGPQYQKYLTWKRHITSFQLVQFASMIGHQVVCLFVTKGEFTMIGLIYLFVGATIFLVLFSRFYVASYTKPKKEANKNDAKNSNGCAKSETAKAQ